MIVTLAAQLRLMRTRRDLTQRELADRVGMKNTAVSLFETGSRVPSEEQLEALTSACGITPEDLRIIVPRWDEIEETHRWERVAVEPPPIKVRRVVDPLAALISDDSPYPTAQCSLRGAW